jgi:hypothetical protein
MSHKLYMEDVMENQRAVLEHRVWSLHKQLQVSQRLTASDIFLDIYNLHLQKRVEISFNNRSAITEETKFPILAP